MTTAVDDQKKNAAKVLEVFGSFRGCFEQWSNLVAVRRQTFGWKYDVKKFDLDNILERRHPSDIDDLGLRDRLASLGAKLLPDLNGFMGEPAISQGALKEIVSLCEQARDNTLLISPQPGKYLGPAFDVLEADLKSLSGSAETAIASPATDPDEADLTLTKNHARVVKTMARFDNSLLLSAEMIAGEMDPSQRLSVRTILKIVARLIEIELAERPESDHSGARLKMKGRRLAQKIAD